MFTFLGSGLEMAIRFPLETVLRRAQIASYTCPSIRQSPATRRVSGLSPRDASPSTPADPAAEIETIIPTPKTYRGIIGTIWGIVYEEGAAAPPENERAHELLKKTVSQKKKQGQGIQGLYRGWRIGMWGIVGIWGAGVLGSAGGSGDEEVMVSGGRF